MHTRTITPQRVALLLDLDLIPAWVETLANELARHPGIELVQIIVAADRRSGERAAGTKPSWREGRISRGLRRRLTALYRRLVDRNLGIADAWRPVTSDWPSRVPVLNLQGLTVSDDERAQIAALSPDVVVHCGVREVPDAVLEIPPCGVWSLLGVPAAQGQVMPAGFWPAIRGQALTRSLLVASRADAAPVVLYESWQATSLYSTRENISRHYWKTLYAIPRALARLHEIGHVALLAEVRRRYGQSMTRAYDPGYPNPLRYAAYVLRAICRKAVELVDTNLFEQRWRLRRARPFALAGRTRLAQVWKNPDACYRADPFLWKEAGQHYLFFEEYCDRSQRAHLAVQPVDAHGHPDGSARDILKRPYHLSYPQVFAFEGGHYLLPETSANRTVELYRATSFPDEWAPAAVLMEDVDASDATVLRHDDTWWLFANLKVHDAVSSQDECFLFFADALEGPWHPHPLNPIVSDCRTSRPAGAMLKIGSRLIRPTQDSHLPLRLRAELHGGHDAVTHGLQRGAR